MITGHGGNIYDLANRLGVGKDEIIDMSSNLNPLGPPPGLVDYLKEHLLDIVALPEVDAGAIISAFAGVHGVRQERVLAGQGTTQFIYALPRALDTKKALIFGPTYADYEDALVMNRKALTLALSDESTGFNYDIESIIFEKKGVDTVFICNPNNPTGTLIPASVLKKTVKAFPDIRFVVDESYLPFSMTAEQESLITVDLPNLIILSSMSKIYRIPGLRVGFIVGPEHIIEKCRKFQFPWSVNSLAQVAAHFILTHEAGMKQFIEESREFIDTERQYVVERLKQETGLVVFSGPVPYILIKLTQGLVSDEVCKTLSNNRILIRNCANFRGLSNAFIRISVKTRDVNKMVLDKLTGLFSA